jgi:cellulose synthase/poly-beta-1,6-N-acetylglucosamine synthase-like glycosyltransferase
MTFAYVLIAFPVVLAIYAYVGYPFLLWIVSRFYEKAVPRHAAALPAVSVVIPAYNEEKQISGAIDAVLAQDYPAILIQALVLSDASTDATDQIVAGYAGRGVELLRMPERSGKTKAENAACALLRGEIVVNTDASIRLHPAAVRQLIAHMSDPTVGVASGRDVSISATREGINPTEAGYVGYEMRVRELETRTGGIVGASGSCYAIRADLHRIPIRDELSRDFSAALTAREHGLRAVSVDGAICFVTRTASLQREYRRKLRTISRGMTTLLERRRLLNPIRYGAFAWKLFSHKVCRWLLPLAAIPGAVGLLLLAPDHLWARITLVAGAGVGILALAGALWPAGKAMPRLLSVAAFGTAANLAVVNALWRMLTGQRDHVWEPTRRSD